MRHKEPSKEQAAGRTWLIVGAAVAGLLIGTLAEAQVYVTDSPSAAELVASAEDRLSKREPAEASRLLQRVLDDTRARLLETDEGRYAEAHEVAARLLLSDDDLLATYREMHGPTASRQLHQAGNDRDRLARVRHRFPATEAAAKAALREAGLALAAGQPEGAVVALEPLAEHPDVEAHRTQYEQLMASAALLLQNMPVFERYHEALRQQEAEDAVAFLDRFKASLRLPESSAVYSPLDTLPETPLPDVLADPLWTYEVRGAEQYLVESYQADEHRIEALGEDGRFLNTMFSVADGVVYLNDGLVVAALDSSSGMEIWRRELTEMEAAFQPFGRPHGQWLPHGVDLNAVAVGEDRVAAISGFGAMVTIYGGRRRDGESKLVVLDAKTGETHWSAQPEDVAESLDDGFWYGRPLIHQGRVYATLRRRQRTQFQDAYVVCLDLHSGETVWRRHIASSALTDRQSVPAMEHMRLHNGYLYVDSRLGTVARLAAADGSIAWLSMLPIDEEERAEVIQKPWHAGAPVLVEAGLLVHDDWGEQIFVVDAETGERGRTVPFEEWGKPLYLMAVEGDVVAVGESVIRLDGASLEPQWRYSVGGDHRGRAAVARNRLLLPADENVHVIDLDEGKLAQRLDLLLPATLLTLNGQVLAAGREQVSSYSSWDLASEQMQQRIEENPDDPRPLMAKAWLAFNTDRHEALLETLDEAIALTLELGVADGDAAAEAGDGSLFEQVMAMIDADRGSDELRLELFDRVAALADDVAQEVAYRLALGAFRDGRGQHAQAMEQYQTLLAESAYRQQLYQHEGGARQAGLEAQRRMQELIDEHGRELYQPYEAFAARRLEELAEQGDPAPLIDLAEAYPMAEVTPEVLRVAARRAADQDRLRQALALLRQASQLTDEDAHLARIYGLQAELFEEAQQPHRARRVLRTLSVVHPEIEPIRGGEPIAVAQWMDELAGQRQLRGVAELNMPLSGEPRVIPGRIVEPKGQDPHASPSSNWLLRGEEGHELRGGEDFELIWSLPLETEDAEVLSMDRSRIWFWLPSERTIRAVDAEDGSVDWEHDELATKLDTIEVERRADGVNARFERNADALRAVQREREGPEESMVAVSDVAVAAADDSGRVVVLDSESGHVQWQRATRLSRATHLVLDGRYLIIAGADGEDVPAISIYDAVDGERLHRLGLPAREPVRWMGVSEDGLLVYLSESRIEAFDLGRGQSRWICEPDEELTGEGGTWLGLDRLVARSRSGDLLWVDLTDGQVAGKLAVRGQLQGQVEARHDAGSWFITSNNTVIATDNDGKRLWRDSIADVARQLDHVLTDRYLIVLGTLVDNRSGGGAHKRRLYMLDRTSGVIEHEHEVEAEQMLINVMATDGKLLLTGPTSTAVLAAPP